jgi:hypothetical protein
MLLVVIFGLALALVMEHRRSRVAEQMALANAARAAEEAHRARAAAELAEARLRTAQEEAKGSSPRPAGEAPGGTAAGGGRQDAP